jgi:hypothetical protein
MTKKPLEALTAMKEIAGEAQQFQQELQNMEPVEALHFSQLIETLPDVPPGWNATDPQGSTAQMGRAKVSTAKREYREEGTGKEVIVEIADWAFHQMLYMGFFAAAKFSQETTEGYQKGITVGEWPGMESYTYQRKSGQRVMLVHKRYNIKVGVINAEATEFDVWMNRVKTDRLPKQ